MDAEITVTDKESNAVRDYALLHSARNRIQVLSEGPFGSQIQALFSCPDLLPVLAPFRLEVDDSGGGLEMVDAERLRVPPSALRVPQALAVRVRHRSELHAWRRAASATGCNDGEWVACVLALHAALAYLNLLPEEARSLAWSGLPAALKYGFEDWRVLQESGASAAERVHWLDAHAHLLHDGARPSARDPRRAAAIAVDGLALAHPVEELLTTGGDKRLRLSPQTALNKYGCSPRPRPWAATFSTCTASSVSAPAFRAAELSRRALFASVCEGRFKRACATRMEALRQSLALTLGLDRDAGAEVVLTASGTDAELLAIYCATQGQSGNITNIVISPKEVGSGTVHAAGGRHFDPSPPLGAPVVPGDPVDGFDAQRIRVVALDVRDAQGQLRDPAAVDTALRECVAHEAEAARFTIVHLLDCSKTGFGAPSLDVLLELQRIHGRAFAVIVDAAQMRVSRRMLRKYLAAGFLVIATGSKFFTGPPFSGALLVPKAHSPVGAGPLPAGLADYCARSDFPAAWRQLTKALPAAANLGLMLRWSAALWEMRAFFSVPAHDRRAIFSEFAERMRGHLDSVPAVVPLPAEVYPRNYRHGDDDWDQVQTIFSFYVRREDSGRGDAQCIGYDEAVRVYHWLNSDVAAALPEGASAQERELAGHCCHIGQPVRVQSPDGHWCGALRIAVGARLVSRVAYDPSLGSNRAERLRQQEQSARQVLEKVAVICRYWPEISAAELAPSVEAAGATDRVHAEQAYSH